MSQELLMKHFCEFTRYNQTKEYAPWGVGDNEHSFSDAYKDIITILKNYKPVIVDISNKPAIGTICFSKITYIPPST